MSKLRNRLPWTAIAAAMIVGALATPVLAAAAWQGQQLDASFAIDTAQAKAEIPMDVAASAITFRPASVTIDDNPKKSTKTLHLKLKFRNQSDTDYYLYTTANLLDADGKVIASQSQKAKADDDDNGSVSFKFKLKYADAERVKKCGLRFGLEKE
jgi:hypothetical protein